MKHAKWALCTINCWTLWGNLAWCKRGQAWYLSLAKKTWLSTLPRWTNSSLALWIDLSLLGMWAQLILLTHKVNSISKCESDNQSGLLSRKKTFNPIIPVDWLNTLHTYPVYVHRVINCWTKKTLHTTWEPDFIVMYINLLYSLKPQLTAFLLSEPIPADIVLANPATL